MLLAVFMVLVVFAARVNCLCSSIDIPLRTYHILPNRNVTTPYSNAYSPSLYYQISDGFVCDEVLFARSPCEHKQSNVPYACLAHGLNSSITITTSGWTNLTALSLSDAELESLFAVIDKTVTALTLRLKGTGNESELLVPNPDPFPITGQLTLNGYTNLTLECMNAGTGGYYFYEPLMNCVEGILSGCDGSGALTDGLAIAACAPQLSNNQLLFPPINGFGSWIDSGVDIAGSLSRINGTAPLIGQQIQGTRFVPTYLTITTCVPQVPTPGSSVEPQRISYSQVTYPAVASQSGFMCPISLSGQSLPTRTSVGMQSSTTDVGVGINRTSTAVTVVNPIPPPASRTTAAAINSSTSNATVSGSLTSLPLSTSMRDPVPTMSVVMQTVSAGSSIQARWYFAACAVLFSALVVII